MMTWQPIESAPRGEGSPVLVWDGAYRTVAHFVYGGWYVHNSYGFNEDGQIYDVTHWMPLPKPPKVKKKE